MHHAFFMRRCLTLAEEGRGKVGNGAFVGAVLVRDGDIIAEGVHRGFGLLHAERDLLEQFSGSIEPTDTLYVNLEPCCHMGKTPPCTEIILKRGVKHLVYGLRDPDRRVSGQGIEFLRLNGVEVIGPVLRDECAWMNRGFISVREKGRPWITLKSARAADGSIAHPDGSPKRITSKEQDAWSHEFLRAKHDAILVGVNTIIKDDPSLTVRSINVPVQPWRIVFDPHARTPLHASIIKKNPERTILVVDAALDLSCTEPYLEREIHIWRIPCIQNMFDFHALFQGCITSQENFCGITSILVEGGERTWHPFWSHHHVDMDVLLPGSS